MGYSHYWSVQRAHPAYTAAWPTIIEDTRRIITAVRNLGVVIGGPDGTRRPILDPTEGIAFNGDATTDLDYETFELAPPVAPPTTPPVAPPSHRPPRRRPNRQPSQQPRGQEPLGQVGGRPDGTD